MNSAKKFLKSSIIYFVGNVMTKVISFLLLPLYTTHLVAADMGYFDLSVSYLNILMPVICMEIWSGIMRFIFDYTDEEDKYKVVFNGLCVFGCSISIYTILAIVLGSVFNVKYIIYIYLYGLFTMIQFIYSYIARSLEFNAIFAISGIISSLVNSISNIIMILFFGMGLKSLYVAMILGIFVQIIILETKVKIIKNISFEMFDKILIKNMVKFSIPLCLNSACFWFLSGYNRVGISNTLGLEANGIYSVAGKFTTVISLVASCFSLAWQELVYSMKNDKEDKARVYTVGSNYYIQFLMMGLLMIIPLVKIVFPYMIGKEYGASFSLIPVYIFAIVASIYSGFLGEIFAAEKRTNVLFISTIFAAITNLVLFYSLVGFIGIQAANVSLLCGFCMNILIRFIIIKKSIPIKLNYKFIAITTVLFIFTFGIYLKQSAFINFILFLVYVVASLFIFRDLIKQLLSIVKAKIQK